MELNGIKSGQYSLGQGLNITSLLMNDAKRGIIYLIGQLHNEPECSYSYFLPQPRSRIFVSTVKLRSNEFEGTNHFHTLLRISVIAGIYN